MRVKKGRVEKREVKESTEGKKSRSRSIICINKQIYDNINQRIKDCKNKDNSHNSNGIWNQQSG